ncbi:hypothetical protein RXV94_14040 [Yeosuana sp. MJ-SS3]|uniref:DUF8201 domain-containing protein n=1 Tax=Gilvirhabdus luticola TaxID=3079858 RepID=A0ABU3UA51_9FLAO|nr:hypothetical protein [Yeosuana sp. MJ-SS3]MDU8887288.1 hypothetical protein [Yeosuana sp. MJ-SS3]
MLLILLSWVYILAISIVLGLCINKGFKVFTTDSVVTIFLGFFGITLFTGFWAIFFAVSWQFHIILLVLSAIALKFNGHAVRSYFENLKQEIHDLSQFFKIILGLLCIFILAQCASPPFIIDNESYYIHTIKWLNEYGLVKGLVNLHLFLGQTSGWHILQSAFSFSFVYDSFNDLSGLCLLLGNYFAIVRLNQYVVGNEKNKLDLIIGLFPVFNVFLFQFIAAPSPDIAVYVIGLIVFYVFAKNYSNYSKMAFTTIAVLSLFLVIIKISTFFFLAFPLVIFVKHFVHAKKHTRQLIALGSLTLLLIVVKNLVVTGNAIYPIASIESLSLDWHLPKTIETYFQNYGLAYGYNVTPEIFETASFLELFKSWLLQPDLHGIFNGLMILLLLVSPWFIIKSKHQKAFGVIYSVAVLNLLFLFVVSPQYRFFFPFVIILSLYILSMLIKKQKTIKVIVSLCLVVPVVPLLFGMKVTMLSENPTQTTSVFKLNYILNPYNNSQFESDFKTLTFENTTLNTPTNIDFFWATGNTPIPAINTKQLEYFKTYFKIIPQQRTEDIKDGFYSKSLE